MQQLIKNHIQPLLFAILALLLAGCAHFHSPKEKSADQAFTDVTHALAVYQTRRNDFNTNLKASTYLREHPKESIAPLLEVVKTKGYKWQSCGSILAKTKEEQVLYAYQDLLAENMFETKADGSRKLSAPRGVSYGGNIAKFLGEMGDERAIPVLRNAVDQGDHQVRRAAIEALYYLGDISMDQLLEMGVNEGYDSTGPVILSIAWNDKYSSPAYILFVLDCYINSFPDQTHGINIAHRYKVDCYDYLGKYDQALKEADLVLKLLGYQDRLISKKKERISNKMILPPTDTWTYTNALEKNAEYQLNLDVLFKTGEVKVSTAYTSFFKACNHPASDTNSVYSICKFPTETSVPELDGDTGVLATSHSSYGVSCITKTGVVIRVEFECRSLSEDDYNCDVDHSILIPFGGTGRCKKDDVWYRWKWQNLKMNPQVVPVVKTPLEKGSVQGTAGPR